MDRMEGSIKQWTLHLEKEREVGGRERENFSKKKLFLWLRGHSEAGGASCAPAAHPLDPHYALAARMVRNLGPEGMSGQAALVQ